MAKSSKLLVLSILAGFALTGCGAESSEPSANAASPVAEVPEDPRETVEQWWQALQDEEVERASALMDDQLTEELYTDDRLRAMAVSMNSLESCDIELGAPDDVEGGTLITADLSGCQFNELTEWTWEVSSETGLIARSNTGEDRPE